MVNHNSRATPIYKNKYPASLINHYHTHLVVAVVVPLDLLFVLSVPIPNAYITVLYAKRIILRLTTF